MIDVGKQKMYWLNGAKDDFETAKILIRSKRMLHGLFFCHLAVEKIIKAHVVVQTKEFAPRSHNLIYLSDIAKIIFNDEDEMFLGILMKYQLQGRYPDYNPTIPDKSIVFNYVDRTEKLIKWLEEKL
jgi:HEPN domain-containing protein